MAAVLLNVICSDVDDGMLLLLVEMGVGRCAAILKPLAKPKVCFLWWLALESCGVGSGEVGGAGKT